ncbi:DUF2975 domain-containing protein [Clostridium tagluense]|uniref:DUF2975 domain-containing protein n=1 Tax=Clostridium tagluense TaxID=360422 RepID=A0A401UNS3_9CLOT|nr:MULTISPECIES: DUF2975 domain-containing protein [Clostridium]MBU3128071.1 DUF2975 domain-containing protein [Clostridium tagluense]MBZ9636481.1 DUF2975 domain-containing protein [Clostridium sp. FP1]MCB2311792.1 DUF2975 domain-containing protein [Clostridium tagluense]MCB2316486.1 DUF2975 domain-containing protein [Clostridium tagluense]MCB2321372.1 DUF2975 domain-containing protein [Clostridium tagluense]
MKYYGKMSLASLLKISLDIMIIIGIVVYFTLSKGILMEKVVEMSWGRFIITYILFSLGGIAVILILFNLRKIVSSLINVTPFINDNVLCLKRISLLSFVISICYAINFVINGQYKNFKIAYVDNSGIHTDIEFLIFFFAGCFILILSQVFKQAVEAKEENEFTI